jgi:WXXGXW repeat (2 copies)
VRPSIPFFTLVALTGSCVIGRATRPSLPEAARGPSEAPVTGRPIPPQTTPADADDPAPAPAKPGSVWVRGYWHWDGVRYVWERGRWETSTATAP